MSDYLTTDVLRAWIGSDTTNFEGAAQAACTVASRAVEKMCSRYFYADGSVSARYYEPDDYYTVCVDDISTTTGLLVATDDGRNGSYSTSWTIATDFLLEPQNASASGETVPYTEICATGTRFFPAPYLGRHKTVSVTAKWGWASTPDAVTHATRLYAAWLFKQKDAPDGFIGLDGWGPRFLRENPTVHALLQPYMRDPLTVA